MMKLNHLFKLFILLLLAACSSLDRPNSTGHFGRTPSSDGETKKVIITDMLDDDIRALIHTLAHPTRRYQVAAIVVSTGNAPLKAEVAKSMVQAIGLSIPVITGTSTDLSNNGVTRFASNNEAEGARFLFPDEVEQYRQAYFRGSLTDSDYSQLINIFKQAEHSGEKLDVVALTAPTDLVKAIEGSPSVSERVLRNLYSMGFYKQNADGKLITPYNTMADPKSVVKLIQLLNSRPGLFQTIYHMRSDVIQNNTGLPGGYFPNDIQLRSRLINAMNSNVLSQRILQSAVDYNKSWRDAAISQFGNGFDDSSRWVPSTFTSPSEAVGFYFADSIPMDLAFLESSSVEKLSASQTTLANVKSSEDLSKPFQIQRAENTRAWVDVESYNGNRLLEDHIEVLERPMEVSNTFKSRVTNLDEAIRRSQKIAADITTGSSQRALRFQKPLVIVFKNSPDDWMALAKICSDPHSLLALKRGGIIAEGFDTNQMAKSVLGFLKEFGIEDISVAAGTKYDLEEIASIRNLDGERLMLTEGQSFRAFNGLSGNIDSSMVARSEDILSSVHHYARSNNTKIDFIVLGEGADLVGYTKESPDFKDLIDKAFVMGGGRPVDGENKFTLSRNWVRLGGQITDFYSDLASAGAEVNVFSSHIYGGSYGIVRDAAENVFDGQTLDFSGLVNSAEKSPAINSIIEHMENWTRVFAHHFNRAEDKGPFQPDASVKVATTSPLGLRIADYWVNNEVYRTAPQIAYDEYSLRPDGTYTVSNDGMRFFKYDPYLDKETVAQRFIGQVDQHIAQRELNQLDTAVRRAGLFSDEGSQALKAINSGSSGDCVSSLKRLLKP